MLRPPLQEAPGQAGIALIETLVALLVLSFGLLALAGSQLKVLADSTGASNRNIASQLASDIADRIRLNPPASGAANAYLASDWQAASDAEAPDADCEAVHCSPAQIAAYDLWAWQQSVDLALPQSEWTIRSRKDAGGLLFVRLAWAEPAVGDPIPPHPDWDCPADKTCTEVVVAVPQP